MRHPTFRSVTALLALSLAIAPIPAFALRAGLEGTDAEKKLEAALTSPRTGLEEPRLNYNDGTSLTETAFMNLPLGAFVGLRAAHGSGVEYAVVLGAHSETMLDVKAVNPGAQLLPRRGDYLLGRDEVIQRGARRVIPAKGLNSARGTPVQDVDDLTAGGIFSIQDLKGHRQRVYFYVAQTSRDPHLALKSLSVHWLSEAGEPLGPSTSWRREQFSAVMARHPRRLSQGTGLEEGRFALSMQVDRSVTSAVQAASARIAQLPELIRNAHERIPAAGGRFMPRADVETAAAQNPFIRIGAEWQEDPTGHPGQIRVISRLGPYTMPDHLIAHPEELRQVQVEADAFRDRFAAEGTELRRVDHLGMGGSAGIGRALQQSGLLRQRPGTVVETSDRSVWRALLPDAAEAIVEYLKTTGVEPMSMGMTSEEPVILLAYYAELCRVLGVPLDPRLEMLTLKNSSVYQFAEAQQMAHRLIALQPDGRETAAGRMSGPTATKFPLRFLALNGIDLTEWVGQARLSQEEQETFLSLGTALAVLAEQGKNKVTLMLPKELAFLAPWLKQLFEESLGRVGKGPLDQFDPQVPFKVVIDEPLDPAFHRPAAESDRVFLTLQTDDARLSAAQAGFLTQMRDAGHSRLDVTVHGAWAARLSGIFQGGLVALAGVANRWGLRFINQPSVEEYKRIAKLMVIEVMKVGGYLKAEDFEANGAVIPKRYFEELPRWILRKLPMHVEFSQTAMYQDILQPATPLPTAVDGQVHVTYAGLAPEVVQAQVSAMGGSMTNAADVVRAILALKKSSTTPGPVMGGTFRPTPVIAHYGDLQHTEDGRTLAEFLQETATRLFRRPWQIDVDVNEGPRYNHATHEMEINDHAGVTIILLPMTTPDSPIVSMSDDYRVIQALATYEALRKAGRTVMLVTYPQNNAAGRAVLETFVRQVETPAGLEEARVFALTSTEGKELAEQLGPAPGFMQTAIREIAWVPAEVVQAARRRLPASPRPGQFPVFMTEGLFDRLPESIRTSKVITRHRFIPDPVPAAEAMVLTMINIQHAKGIAHVPIVRFFTVDEVAGFTEEAMVAIATNRLFKDQEIYWMPASAQSVKLGGQDGFAFYL